jgi:hypothetical protein
VAVARPIAIPCDARAAGRERRRVCLRLGERRHALPDDDPEGPGLGDAVCAGNRTTAS